MSNDLLYMSMEIFTFVGILVSVGIFGRLAIKAKNIGSFRFQLSAFILIWAVAEVLYVGQDLGVFSASGLDELGLTFHFASMAAFALFVGTRSYKFLRAKPALPPPPPVRPVPLMGALEK
jgi:hypothetical protein